MSMGKVDKVFKINMPRGEKDEVIVDIDRFEDVFIYDEDGNRIRFGDIYVEKKSIVILLRHPQCFTTKEYVEDLAKIPQQILDSAGVQLVTVGPHKPDLIPMFREETGFKQKMFCDPNSELYTAVGIIRQMNPNLRRPDSSKHVKSGWVSGIISSTYRAMWYRDFGADMKQNGACLILGPGRVLHSSHLDTDLFDHRPINAILHEVCGRTMDFPKDRRVIQL